MEAIKRQIPVLQVLTGDDMQESLKISSTKLNQLQRELDIEAALEQVRVRSMAMHKSEQLPETAKVLFEQFGLLGKIPDRMSIGIINEESRNVELWVTDQHGNQLNHEFSFSLDEPTSMAKIYAAWKKGEASIIVDLTGQNLQDWLQFVKEEAKLPLDESKINGRRVQQAAFFSQGFLLCTTHEPVSAEIMQLLRRFAKVFDLTYTRFRDLLKAESAKEDIEKTLAELKAAQAQLIQSEKMASLGEITAGIAHEIQNPLNFINNFSEINKELIAEVKQAMKLGNFTEALSNVNTIEANEEKITEHGKRAAAIVKSMLEHSQASSGREVPTSINALADECMRLSLHGMRAKNKYFNVILNTDFDRAIGTINILPKEIGRVLLNLYNNAFYAVNEKKSMLAKAMIEGYEPEISVATRKMEHQIEIRVKDNGNGIPGKYLDKVFQPFFTTKPPGQGTGLGLSLSYDIVRAQGGQLKVESREGIGTEFVVVLPAA